MSFSPHLKFLSKPSTQYGINLLHIIPKCQNIKDLKRVKSHIIVQGLVQDEPLVGVLIKACFNSGNPSFALNIFERLNTTSLFLQNFVIRCLSANGLYGDILSLYMRCQSLGYGSNNYTYPFVIKACASLCAVRAGKEAHCNVLRRGYEQNIVVQTALVDMYAKTGDVKSARVVLDKIPQPDLVSLNALLSGYSYNGLDHVALEVFREIQVKGFKPNVSTFASLIPVCARLGGLDIGRSVHGLMVKCGVCAEETLVPALVSMYGSMENLSVVRELFDLLEKKNVVVCNAMISVYTQNRKASEAFEVYRQMLRENVLPNFVTYVSVIPSFDGLDNIQCGESVHACVIKHGLEHQTSVVTVLLSMYAKVGDIKSAQFLFGGMTERNLLSWNSIISGHVLNGLYEEGLAAFRQMQSVGLVPDSVTTISIISASTALKHTQHGMSAHAYCVRNGFDSNLNVSNALLKFYTECDKFPTSVKLLDKMIIRNVVSWNTLISSCVHKGDNKTIVKCLNQMQQDDVKFDLITMISILPIYSETKNLLPGMAVHGNAVKMGFTSDVSLINALISMYVKCGDLDAGHQLFAGMPLRTVITWNALMTGYRSHNFHEDVMDLYHQMIKEGQKPNFITFLNILPICCSQLQGKSIHAYGIRAGDISEAHLVTSLIGMYARFQKTNLCSSLFERADKSNVTLWNSLMSVHVQSESSNDAFICFREMLQTGVEPDHVTMLTLVSACVQPSSITLTQSLMAFIIGRGFEHDVLVNNSLIDVYSRCGYISVARKIFDSLVVKDVVSWSAMINGYAIHGNGEAAIGLFSQMKCSMFEPDDVTFVSILSACSHAGLVEQGRKLFTSMTEEYGIAPRMEHYACMVDLLGRTGHMAEAYDLVKTLPFKPSTSLLESLLGACSIHGDTELCKEVSRLLFDMNPTNCGSYVMLSNIYATAGMWTDASRVRSMMEEIRLRKIPGFSLLEVN